MEEIPQLAAAFLLQELLYFGRGVGRYWARKHATFQCRFNVPPSSELFSRVIRSLISSEF